MTAPDSSFQYRALFEYKRERDDDISFQPGDILTVPKSSLKDYQEGDEYCPRGWLHGTNERSKEKGDFPGTFVEYAGLMRHGLPAVKPRARPMPPTTGGTQGLVDPGPPHSGATVAGGECGDTGYVTLTLTLRCSDVLVFYCRSCIQELCGFSCCVGHEQYP
ncbi:hypothetical protein DPEC_G00338100 [Dallia pectoralis]|uniref:Uncharacterized protein n=1 Tax=Dallia pectoralis TaxID=75939 RepID=A0ACC2F4F5_DALPE|nr:hypothetical protein DPEC_G00338100 [Dallia pectoralis]